MKPSLLPVALIAAIFSAGAQESMASEKPLRVAIAGLVHGHVNPVLDHLDRGDIQIVGIAEPDAEVAKRRIAEHHLDPALVYPTVAAMLDATKPDAVATFTTPYDHLEVIRACAERGIDVMVEKPLAVTAKQAHEIASLAAKYHIQVLTNYETSWYPTNQQIGRLVEEGQLGSIRKMVAHDGHSGPKEIGCQPEFVAWLTDPKLNGGGALIDFGCYGASLMTWLMKGAKPAAVVAVTQQFKTDPVYAKVDDEATIILCYPKAQGIIQASWNWPYDRKDLEVYGTGGAVIAEDRTHLRQRAGLSAPEKLSELPLPKAPYADPFVYLAAVVRGKLDPSGGLSSLANNVTVVEILDAARRSAGSGRAVALE
jgi:predicted dehydrogenase